MRNGYEWDVGHFNGAERPNEVEFRETPTGDDEVPVPLEGLDRSAPVMMYCTGGIRCDIYSAALRRRGFTNLYTLEGGIANYLRTEGGDHWEGSLFVFDKRMVLPGDLTGKFLFPDSRCPQILPRIAVLSANSSGLPQLCSAWTLLALLRACHMCHLHFLSRPDSLPLTLSSYPPLWLPLRCASGFLRAWAIGITVPGMGLRELLNSGQLLLALIAWQPSVSC